MKNKLTDKSVYVYRNLHTNSWSIRSRKTGKVVERKTVVYLVNPEFRVGEKGRKRVIATNVKNVHAGVAGELIDDDDSIIREFSEIDPIAVYYDPIKNSKFLDKNDNPVDGAAFAKMDIHCPDKVKAWKAWGEIR
jgi:hypothetical protein